MRLSSDTLAGGSVPVNGTVGVAGHRGLLAAMVRFTGAHNTAGVLLTGRYRPATGLRLY
jgi:hypothetical protein